MAIAGLVAVMDFSALAEDEFHDWYDLEHLPERLRIPGFLGGERWVGAANPKLSIGTYDLSSLDVLQSAPYLAIAGANASPWAKRVIGKCQRIARIAADQFVPGDERAPTEGAGGLLFAAMNIPPEVKDEFNAWYEKEHLPMLMAIPGLLSARRFKAREGAHRYITLYHLTTPDVQETSAWKQVNATPWARKLRPHFSDLLRIVGRKYTRA